MIAGYLIVQSFPQFISCMAQQNEGDMAEKQAYIREHIPQAKYEQFYEFCETETSNMDIENWSIDFVKDLVQKFMKMQADRENSNKKKQRHPFFTYQSGNADQIKGVRQQIQQERKNKSQNKQTTPVNTPEKEKPIPKPQQSALQLLDSIFSNNASKNINQSQFQTKKYDKSFFQSCNFWGAPTEQNKRQSPPATAKPQQMQLPPTNNLKPVQIPNFDFVFQTGMNLPQINPRNVLRNQQEKIQVKYEKNTVKPREFKLEEIPIQDEEIPKMQGKQIPTNPIDKKKEIKQQLQQKGQIKPSVKLVSIKSIKKPKIPYNGQILIKDSFNAKVACFKSLQRMNFSSQKLKVTIQNYETINRSFFSSDYIMYHLRVMPANIICKRNLQDFQKLKSSLQAVYPGIRLPYLEKPKWLQSETTPEFIQKQIVYLGYFLDDIFSHPQVRNSRILEDFLTLKDHKSMKRKFQEYQKIKKVTSIQQLCLLEGEVKVQISQQNRQYNQLMVNFLAKMNLFWDSQQQILGEISSSYDTLVDSYHRWMGSVQEIQKEIKDFNQRVRFNQLQSIEYAFQDLSKLIAQCSIFNLNEKKFLQTSMFPMFKFQKQNMNLLSNIMSVQDLLTRAYLKRKDLEKAEDNIEYLSDRLKDFKDSILEESANITVLKYQSGYTSELAVSEGYRYFDKLSQKMVNLISQVCKGRLGRLSQSINVITQLINA